MVGPRRTVTAASGSRFAAHLKCAAKLALCAATLCDVGLSEDRTPTVRFDHAAGRIHIRIDDKPFATYVYQDEEIPRPYFCNVRTPSGRLVTRPRPLGEDDLDDHPLMHPGIWLAFGDLSGNDYWRLKARVESAVILARSDSADGQGTLIVRNRYLSQNGNGAVGEESCRYTVIARPTRTVLRWDSSFRAVGERSLVFGDQEEMGLGVRLASGIAEKRMLGGLLTDSQGRKTAKAVWGQAAAWCDYSGLVDGQPVGITVAGHPDNFRLCWWHARDYGFMAANPFGRAAMKQGPPSRVTVPPGESLRLQFTVVIHDGRPGEGYDPASSLPGEPTP